MKTFVFRMVSRYLKEYIQNFLGMVTFLKFKKDSNECSLKEIGWMTGIHIINFILITRIFGKNSKFFRKSLNTFESSLSSNVFLVMTYKKT